MAIVQAVLALISRSLGRIVSAIFGWAVVALFGLTKCQLGSDGCATRCLE